MDKVGSAGGAVGALAATAAGFTPFVSARRFLARLKGDWRMIKRFFDGLTGDSANLVLAAGVCAMILVALV